MAFTVVSLGRVMKARHLVELIDPSCNIKRKSDCVIISRIPVSSNMFKVEHDTLLRQTRRQYPKIFSRCIERCTEHHSKFEFKRSFEPMPLRASNSWTTLLLP